MEMEEFLAIESAKCFAPSPPILLSAKRQQGNPPLSSMNFNYNARGLARRAGQQRDTMKQGKLMRITHWLGNSDE